CGLGPEARVLGTDRYTLCVPRDMTRKSLFLLVALSFLSFGFGQSRIDGPGTGKEVSVHLRTLPHTAFKAGERLTYIVHYGFLNAGLAVLELKETDVEFQGRRMLHAVGTGKSMGAFNTFYKVDDRYESYFDSVGVFPWAFKRSVDEGGYTFNQDYIFLQNRAEVTTQEKKTFSIPAHTQDMISAFYFARTLDFGNAAKGDVFTIDCFLDNEHWPLQMKVMGRETIKLRNGKFRCIKFQPIVQEGRVFKTNDDLNVWVTDDANHIPVLAQAKVLVGSIKMELDSYSGLTNPISKVE
ncbi:MAG: DUF3108 domain-containing protein, partial [Flavobacteriales bacterium]